MYGQEWSKYQKRVKKTKPLLKDCIDLYDLYRIIGKICIQLKYK